MKLAWCQQERCWRDFVRGTLFHDRILLSSVEFCSETGKRTGCCPSGTLGFALGDIEPPTTQEYDPQKRVSFNGKQFIYKGEPVLEAELVLFFPTGKAMIL